VTGLRVEKVMKDRRGYFVVCMEKKPQEFSVRISSEEVQKRLQAWADVTALSLELKRAALRKRHPGLSDDEVSARVREEIATYGADQDE